MVLKLKDLSQKIKMKILSILIVFTVLACQPKKTETVQQQTISKNKVENSAVSTDAKPNDSSFKNDEGVKTRIPKVATLKKSLTEENPFVEADASFQWDANQKLEKLLKHYGKNIPDYYGGAFINDKGNLVVNIKGNLVKGKEQVIKIIGSKNVLFDTKKYSYKELNSVMDYLNEYSRNPKNKPYSENMKTWELREIEGLIGMGLLDDSPEKIREFRKHVSDFPGIVFYHSKGITFD